MSWMSSGQVTILPEFRKAFWKALPFLSLRAIAKQSVGEGIASSLRFSQ
jgi:hypothetical protein